jgi:hypothetical protein
MLVTSRRSLILGLSSLIAAPALVKASSLMPLRGYNMDPLIVAYRFKHPTDFPDRMFPNNTWLASDFNIPDRRQNAVLPHWIDMNNHLEYRILKRSEVNCERIDESTSFLRGGITNTITPL